MGNQVLCLYVCLPVILMMIKMYLRILTGNKWSFLDEEDDQGSSLTAPLETEREQRCWSSTWREFGGKLPWPSPVQPS